MDNTDKWNNWTYNTGIRGYFNGQKSYSNNDLNLNVSAERITEENKIVLSGYLNNNESIFYNFESDTAEDGTVNEVDYISQKSHNRLTFKFVHSINEYMGTGIKVKYYSNTYNNIEKSISISPGIEYNFILMRRQHLTAFQFYIILRLHIINIWKKPFILKHPKH